MPTAPVDGSGTILYYEDSGPPRDSTDYTTLVLIHGTCFHAATFGPLIPFALTHNMRLVRLNMREYPGSTLYSDEELALLGGSHDEQTLALQARGLELAAFLRWFVETERIPPRSPDDRGGGISVLGWSGGNHLTLGMFAHVDALSKETRTLLDGYLRTLILYEPSTTTIGSSIPPGFAGANLSVGRDTLFAEQVATLMTHVSSFYPPFTLPETLPASVDTYPPPRIALQDINPAVPLDPKYAPTTSPAKMRAEDFAGTTHAAVLARLQPLIWAPSLRPVSAANAARALFDCRILQGGARAWPGVPAHLLFGDMTVGVAAWAAAVLRCEHAAASVEARREMEVHVLEGANHFIHWEHPEGFMNALATIV